MDDYIIEYKWMIIGDLVNHSSGKPKNKTAISERFLFQIKFRIGFLGGLPHYSSFGHSQMIPKRGNLLLQEIISVGFNVSKPFSGWSNGGVSMGPSSHRLLHLWHASSFTSHYVITW